MTASIHLANMHAAELATIMQGGSIREIFTTSSGGTAVDALADSLAVIFMSLDFSASYGALDNAQGRGRGPCASLAESLAQEYGAQCGRIVPHGSSLANLATIIGLAIELGRPPKVIAERTVHLSSVGGMILSCAEVVWIDREYLPELGVQRPICAQQLNEILERERNVDAVLLTLPTYTGFLPDLVALRRVCDDHGVKLIADSAWGGLLGLLEAAGFPASPALLADVAVVSLHKKGIGLSGASVVLFNDKHLLRGFDLACDLGLVSTSPPYYAYLPLERSLAAWRSAAGQVIGKQICIESKKFGAALDSLPGIRWLRSEDIGPNIQSDPSHVLLNVSGTGLTGYRIRDVLASQHAIDAEMATVDTLLFLFGPRHVEEWPQIVSAVSEVLTNTARNDRALLPPLPKERCKPELAMWQALYAPHVCVQARAAVGRIAAQTVAAYPPGAAIIAPGEVVTAEVIDYLEVLEAVGSRFKGIDGRLADVGLRVVAPR